MLGNTSLHHQLLSVNSLAWAETAPINYKVCVCVCVCVWGGGGGGGGGGENAHNDQTCQLNKE